MIGSEIFQDANADNIHCRCMHVVTILPKIVRVDPMRISGKE
jgi:hypothetical protein